MRDGKRYRLYADLRENEEKNLPMVMNDAAGYFISPEKPDLAKLSTPSADLSGLVPGMKKKREHVGTGVLYPENVREKIPGYLAVVDFKPRKGGKLTLQSLADNKWLNSEVWMNGEKITFRRHTAELTPRNGVNRIVLKSPQNRVHFLFLNGENESCVEFLPLK